MSGTQLSGPVLIVGAGLIGTSVGLSLAGRGLAVHLADSEDTHLEQAARRGAGGLTRPHSVELVVVAVPPADTAGAVVAAVWDWPDAVITDVASVKAGIAAQVAAIGTGASRYVGGHPMAGNERSGPGAASATLFRDRPWAITPSVGADSGAVATVQALVEACGGHPVMLTPTAHDEAVASLSHLPHVVAALAAARLLTVPADQLALTGQGVRDVTRIAAGDPELWRQILCGNAQPLRPVLEAMRRDLDAVLTSLSAGGDSGPLADLLDRGQRGRSRLPAG